VFSRCAGGGGTTTFISKSLPSKNAKLIALIIANPLNSVEKQFFSTFMFYFVFHTDFIYIDFSRLRNLGICFN
jgi:hypothetical protein